MSRAAPVDNTTLPSGDVVASEDFPAGAQRGSADVSATDYKVPRSKIAVGRYGVDGGDVSTHNAMPTADFQVRQLNEFALLEAMNNGFRGSATRSCERVSLVDRRGSNGNRGVR